MLHRTTLNVGLVTVVDYKDTVLGDHLVNFVALNWLELILGEVFENFA